MKHGFPGMTYDDIEAAFVGYCHGESMSGKVGFAVAYLSTRGSPTKRHLWPRHDWHPDNERQQQLLHWEHSPLSHLVLRQVRREHRALCKNRCALDSMYGGSSCDAC